MILTRPDRPIDWSKEVLTVLAERCSRENPDTSLAGIHTKPRSNSYDEPLDKVRGASTLLPILPHEAVDWGKGMAWR